MEIEPSITTTELKKDDIINMIRQKLKEYTANRLLQFDKRIQERYSQAGKKVPEEISKGTVEVFRAFEQICERYVGMFELYCDQNVLVTRIPDTHVTPVEDFTDEEKELDRTLEKRKKQLLECRRRKNILQLQSVLIESDFGKALSRLGAMANTKPMEQLQEDIHIVQQSMGVIHQAQELTRELNEILGKQDDMNEWDEVEKMDIDVGMPLMQVQD